MKIAKWEPRIRRIAYVLGIDWNQAETWVGKNDGQWWLVGCTEGDQLLPNTRGCATFAEAIEAAEKWLAPLINFHYEKKTTELEDDKRESVVAILKDTPEIQELKNRVKELENNHAGCQELVHEHEQMMGVLQDQYFVHDQKVREKIDALEKAVPQVDGRADHGLNQIQSQMDGLRKQFGELETEVRTKINSHCDQSDRGYEALKKLLDAQRSSLDALLHQVDVGDEEMVVLQSWFVEFERQTAKQIKRIEDHAQGLEQEMWKKLDALDARISGSGQDVVVEKKQEGYAGTIENLSAAQALIHELYLEQFPKVSDKDYQIMAHACGAESDPPYLRNYYSAHPNSYAAERLDYLEQEGLAHVLREPDSSMFPDRLYALTKEGLAFVFAWKATRSMGG